MGARVMLRVQQCESTYEYGNLHNRTLRGAEEGLVDGTTAPSPGWTTTERGDCAGAPRGGWQRRLPRLSSLF